MSSRSSKRRNPIEDASRHLEPVETGLAYWLEHVVHWYALLGAVVAILVVGLAMFGHGAMASPY